jgi:UDP-N-acetylmuramate dehydrogenase
VTQAVATAAELLGTRARRDVPLGVLTTYRVGGNAELFVTVVDDDDLVALSEAVRASHAPVLIVGKGSNLLVADEGFAGIAVALGDRYAQVDIDGTLTRAGANASLPVVARRTAAAGLTGFEWAVGVPGSIGGAVRMNAGGHGSDMAETLVRVRRFDLATGEDTQVSRQDLALSFRRSNVEPTQLVLEAELRLRRGDRGRAESEIAEIVRWRR